MKRKAAATKQVSVAVAKPTDLAALISHLEKDANIHAKDYQLYLPSKELLRQKLLDWCGEADVADRERKTKGTAQ